MRCMLVGAALAAQVALAAGCRNREATESADQLTAHRIEVQTVVVSRGALESSIELTGTLVPWKFATIAAEVTGVIEEIPESDEKVTYELGGQQYEKTLPLDIGHQVQRGDLLVKINSSEALFALELARAKQKAAEAELANLLAWKRPEEIAQLRAQCEECEAVLVEAEGSHKRAQTLMAQSATSQQDLENAQREVATAQAAKKRAEAALAVAEAGPTAEQLSVGRAQIELAQADVALKQDAVDKCTIRCPLESASIVERYVGSGDHVTANPSTPLMRIVDSSILLAQVNVPERYQGLIRLNSPARVTAEGGRAAAMQMGAAEAMVVLVNAQIDPDTRTFRVRVGLDNAQQLYKAGTFVRVTIPLRAEPEALIVPAECVTFSKGEPAAFRVRDGIVQRVPVQLGISNRTHYQILNGLSENDVVVQGNLSLLASGLRVVATPEARTAAAPEPVSDAEPSRG